MPAPFGFGVGDFITVATLINNTRTALKDSGGARDEYQELERELALLELALGAIKTLTGPPHRQGEITAIKLVALSCRRTLDYFYSSMIKYDKSLSTVSNPKRARASVKMVQWNLLMQADVTKLRSYLAAHVGSLNVLISTELLKSSSENALTTTEQHSQLKKTIEERWENARKMIVEAAKSADEQNLGIQQRLDISEIAIAKIKTIATESESKIQDTHSVVEQIKEQTDKRLLPDIEEIVATTNQLRASQHETMKILEARLPPPDPRFTWAQAPVRLEDALGRSILIPSEYNYDMLEAVIIAKFKRGPGQMKVHSGDFELFNSDDSSDIIDPSRFTSTGLLPGMRITMAIIIGQYATIKSRCANTSCKSLRFKEAEQGGKICLRCNTWFNQSNKKLCRPFRPLDHGSGDTKTRPSESSRFYRATSINISSDRKSYRNIHLYTTELPSTKTLQRNRFGGSLRKQGLTTDTVGATKNRTFTDVPCSWLQDDAQDSIVRHTTHHFNAAATNNQLAHSEVKCSNYLGTTAKILDSGSNVRLAQEFSNNFLVNSGPGESEIQDFTTTTLSIRSLQNVVPDVERIKSLDVVDLKIEDWEILAQHHRIKELELLGEGAGGIVTKCVLQGQKTLFAIKRLRGSSQPESRKQVLGELRYNIKCNSEWICKYYGAYCDESSGDILIAMEYCEGSCLERIYREVEAGGGRIGEKVLWKVAESVLQGLTYLYGQRIIHRDIKPGNILFCKNGQVKIADFGVAGEFGTMGTAGTFIGTSFYMAPERLTGQYYSISSDVWSLGVSLLEVAQHRHPYMFAVPHKKGADLVELSISIVRGPVPRLLNEPALGIVWSDNFKSFIECCLEKQGDRRATPWRMLEHPWMKYMMGKKVDMERFLKIVWEWD